VERFLQLVAPVVQGKYSEDDAIDSVAMPSEEQLHAVAQAVNMRVVNCTTPAQYFHVLRRQIHSEERKPAVLFTPKFLLHATQCVSTLEEMGPGTGFAAVLEDPNPGFLLPRTELRRVVFCTGKLYYQLLQARKQRKVTDVALIRVEEMAPWPYRQLVDELQRYMYDYGTGDNDGGGSGDDEDGARSVPLEVVWAQEEPRNMGVWGYAQPRLKAVMRWAEAEAEERAREDGVEWGAAGSPSVYSTGCLEGGAPPGGDRAPGGGGDRAGPAVNSTADTTTTEDWHHRHGKNGGGEPEYIGRRSSSSPATGSFKRHQLETTALIRSVLLPQK
jgi:2-oxoglutarate dehydrogenase complex dehydrogenase (E1) component-like enzyme